MGAYKFLMIHCTATVQGNKLNSGDIERMHMGAIELPNGQVRYKGKNYDSRKYIPEELLGGVPASETRGRGWDRVGYSKAFFEDGHVHNFVEHNDDNWISSNELTYGAVGFNEITKHFVYAGGLGKEFEMIGGKPNHPFKNTMSTAQEYELISAVKAEIKKHPHIKVIGHNQTAVKGCPCFDVRAWGQLVGIPNENIDHRALKVTLKHDKNKYIPPSQVFKTKAEGDLFRSFVNDTHPEYAKSINLDRYGSHTNSYILKAWEKYGAEYLSKP